MTTIIFGDVHGRADKLYSLINFCNKHFKNIQYYSLGDLIDRGNSSKEVIQLCIDNKVKGVLGNHELWLIKALQPNESVENGVTTPIMGGRPTLTSYGVTKFTPKEQGEQLRELVPLSHREYLESLRTHRIIESGGKKWVLIHGGVNKNIVNRKFSILEQEQLKDEELLQRLVDSDLMTLLWSPSKIGGDHSGMHKFKNATQILGHSPTKNPINIQDHYIAIDTGCGTCEPFLLTACVIHDSGQTEIISF